MAIRPANFCAFTENRRRQPRKYKTYGNVIQRKDWWRDVPFTFHINAPGFKRLPVYVIELDDGYMVTNRVTHEKNLDGDWDTIYWGQFFGWEEGVHWQTTLAKARKCALKRAQDLAAKRLAG